MDTDPGPSRAEIQDLVQSFFDHPERQSFKDREVIKMIVNRAHKASFKGKTRETVPFEIGRTAYRYILESGGSAEEALEYSAKMHSESFEWLNSIKNHPYYYSAAVVKDHDQHPQQKLMLKNGTMDKSALKGSETVNKQIRKLSRYKRVSDSLESLKQTDIEQQKQIDKLSADVSVSQSEIEELKKRAGVKPLSNKEKGKILFDKGYTQKHTADYLGVDIRTVKRWWLDY